MRNNIGLTHYQQLLFYIERWAETGEYYGDKKLFLKRHECIMKFVQEAITKLESKAKVKA